MSRARRDAAPSRSAALASLLARRSGGGLQRLLRRGRQRLAAGRPARGWGSSCSSASPSRCSAAFATFFFYLRNRARQAEIEGIASEWAQLQRSSTRHDGPVAAPDRLGARRPDRQLAGLGALADGGAVRRLDRLLRLLPLALPRARAIRSPTTPARTSHASSWLEGGVAVAEAVLLIGLSIPLWADRVDEFPAEKDVGRGAGGRRAVRLEHPLSRARTASSAAPRSTRSTCRRNPLGLDRSRPGGQGRRHHGQPAPPAGRQAGDRPPLEQGRDPQLQRPRDAHQAGRRPGHRRSRSGGCRPSPPPRCASSSASPSSSTRSPAPSSAASATAAMRGFVTIDEPAEFQTWMDEQVAAAQSHRAKRTSGTELRRGLGVAGFLASDRSSRAAAPSAEHLRRRHAGADLLEHLGGHDARRRSSRTSSRPRG